LLSGKPASNRVERAGRTPRPAGASFSSYLATWRTGPVDIAITDALRTTHPLARHIAEFLTDLTNAGRRLIRPRNRRL
jgi:hypothetical protein